MLFLHFEAHGFCMHAHTHTHYNKSTLIEVKIKEDQRKVSSLEFLFHNTP
jgi:hypothetical protein